MNHKRLDQLERTSEFFVQSAREFIYLLSGFIYLLSGFWKLKGSQKKGRFWELKGSQWNWRDSNSTEVKNFYMPALPIPNLN